VHGTFDHVHSYSDEFRTQKHKNAYTMHTCSIARNFVEFEVGALVEHVQGWRPLACMGMHAVASADSMMRHELFTCYKVQNSQPLNQPLPAALNGYWQLIARAGEGRAGTCRTARPVQCELDHVHRHWHRMPRPQCEFRGHQRRYLYPHRQYFGSRDRLEAAGVQPAIFRKLRFPI